MRLYRELGDAFIQRPPELGLELLVLNHLGPFLSARHLISRCISNLTSSVSLFYLTMHRYTFLAFLPAVLGCLNPKSNACASFMSANAATASPFCATFTRSEVTATAGLPAWAANCNNKPSMISKECSCYFTGNASPTAKPTTGQGTTLITSTTARVTPTAAISGVTTTLPRSSGAISTSAPITVRAGQPFDGGMNKYDRSRTFEPRSALRVREHRTNVTQPGFAKTRRRLERKMPCLCWRTAPHCQTYARYQNPRFSTEPRKR